MNEKGFETINVIPLVDVMLVLLTIVLTTSTFIAVGAIPLQLPKAVNSLDETVKAVTIEIDRQGQIFLETQPVGLVEICKKLSEHDRSLSILIRADRAIALQQFVELMDAIKGLGFSRVSLQTERVL